MQHALILSLNLATLHLSITVPVLVRLHVRVSCSREYARACTLWFITCRRA